VAQQQLDGAHVGALLQQVRGKCMPQTMRSDGFGNAATIVSSLASPHNCSRADMLARLIPGKQPSLGSCHAPPLAKNFQQFDREHDVTIFLAFALLDADDHSLTIDVGGLEGNGFRETQDLAADAKGLPAGTSP
jgi:hypothetical protein